jgi:predicted nucleotidyltransferase
MSRKIKWERVQSILESTRPKIVAAWAFGSAQSGQVGAESDVDIGILVESTLSLDEQLDLLANLQKALQFEDIDLVVLNEANPILRFEAISGRSLFCRDAGQRAEFASLTAREYEDEMAFWQRGMAMRMRTAS